MIKRLNNIDKITKEMIEILSYLDKRDLLELLYKVLFFSIKNNLVNFRILNSILDTVGYNSKSTIRNVCHMLIDKFKSI